MDPSHLESPLEIIWVTVFSLGFICGEARSDDDKWVSSCANDGPTVKRWLSPPYVVTFGFEESLLLFILFSFRGHIFHETGKLLEKPQFNSANCFTTVCPNTKYISKQKTMIAPKCTVSLVHMLRQHIFRFCVFECVWENVQVHHWEWKLYKYRGVCVCLCV